MTVCCSLWANVLLIVAVWEPISLSSSCMMSCEQSTSEPSSPWLTLAGSCSFWHPLVLSVNVTFAHSGSLCHPDSLWHSLALSGSLWLTLAFYLALSGAHRLKRSLLGSLPHRHSCVASLFRPSGGLPTCHLHWGVFFVSFYPFLSNSCSLELTKDSGLELWARKLTWLCLIGNKRFWQCLEWFFPASRFWQCLEWFFSAFRFWRC